MTVIEIKIEIEVNGEARRVAPGASLLDLVEELGLPPGQAMALAVNRQVVPRQQWRQRPLLALDKIEIVRAIGGG
ncbi:sulfur carrier protein ThiS [Massilia sp. CCM 8694]|uniref:Sulfur carrier protein ThiS n=1 Tax=Massilia genomosp. 1 TaxID=2609280 RepID=A0ABX0MDS8_9BURK|nr:sulfur carrier protein ThiS [Massilia genomosp. 1]